MAIYTQVHPRRIVTHDSSANFSSRLLIAKVNQVVWFLIGLVEVVLAFRILLLAIGAGSNSSFAMFIYDLSTRLILPFRGIVGTSVAGAGTFEWSTVFAMIVYAMIGWIITSLLSVLAPPRINEVVDETELID